MALYSPGDTVLLPVTFSVDGDLTDPTAVTLTIKSPGGASTAYVYGTDDEVTKTTTGTFLGTIVAPSAGVYGVEWVGTDTAAGVYEDTFTVEVSVLDRAWLCSVDEVKLKRRDSGTAFDDHIRSLIPRASGAIEAWAGRQFTIDSSTATVRYFPAPGFARSRTVLIDDLSAAPTAASIVDAYGDTLETLTVATDLVLLPRNRRAGDPIDAVMIRPGHSIPAGGELSLTGVWGFPMVPPGVREAAVETVVEWLKSDQAVTVPTPETFEPGGSPSRGLPQKARDLVRPFKRVGVA